MADTNIYQPVVPVIILLILAIMLIITDIFQRMPDIVVDVTSLNMSDITRLYKMFKRPMYCNYTQR